MDKKVINIKSSLLKDSLSSLAHIAKNALNQEDRLINFMCYDETIVLTATDGARECQIELTTNSNVREVFSLNVEKLQAIATDDGTTRIEVQESFVLFHKDESIIQLPKYKVNHKPFDVTKVDDIVSANHLLKVLRIYSKYLTSEMDDSGVVIFSDNLAYTRNRLYYVITEFELNNHYIFDKVTSKNVISIFGHFKDSDLKLSKVDKGSRIMINCGNTSLKIPLLRHDKINLSQFINIEARNGFIVNRDKLIKVLKEINLVEGTSEIDLIAENERLIVKPSIDTSLTEYKVVARSVTSDDKAPKGFTYTVNLKAFEELLKGVNTDSTMLVVTDKNMLMLINKDFDVLIRYFISVF